MNDARQQFVTLQDLVWHAHQNLPADVWDYLTYGTETETTVRRNRLALDSVALLPRVMRDVSRVNPASQLLGQPLRIPVVFAPIGSLTLFDKDGGLAPAEVARDFGITHILSGYAEPGYQTVGNTLPDQLIYALHPRPGLPPLAELAKSVADAGFKAIAIVSETVFYTRRERDLMSKVKTAFRVEQSYSSLLREARDLPLEQQYSVGGLAGARMNWSMINELKTHSGLKIIVKGIMSPHDAQFAVEHGADAIYVSNHGGRALDHAPATLQMLPSIVAAVGGKIEIIVDGGFVRGTDIIKAIALGATAVGLGKLQAWALAAGGRPGLYRLLQLLEEEIVIAMALLGVNRLSELTPECLQALPPVGNAHPLAAFPVVMERLGIAR